MLKSLVLNIVVMEDPQISHFENEFDFIFNLVNITKPNSSMTIIFPLVCLGTLRKNDYLGAKFRTYRLFCF